MFKRREALLAELGESQTVQVSFVVYPEDFTVPPLMDYRALRVDGTVPGGQLPRMLREIADSVEREDPDEQPALWWDRDLRHVVRPWMDARRALKRALHELDVSDPSSRAQVFDEVERCRRVETEAWVALRDTAINGNSKYA